MAEIKPLKAWRYNSTQIEHIDRLVSPLFDVVSVNQRKRLYQEPYNSIHLSVPENGHATMNASETLVRWKTNGIIVQDPLPAIYVYYQYFNLPGMDKDYCRKGFIANLKITNWNENVLLRHENTIPHSVRERMNILDKTQLHASATHGLYTDLTHEIEEYMDQAMCFPLYQTEDYQGVKDVFAVLHDVKIILRIMELMKGKQIILADGHHRYESSLLYQKQQAKSNPNHTGKEGYNYHLMYFTNTESDDIQILPTHRIIKGIQGFDEEALIKKLESYFYIQPVEESFNINEVILGKLWTFGILFKNQAFKVYLKPKMMAFIEWKFPEMIKKLDLTIMHYFIIEKCLGIPGKEQRDSQHLAFERNFTKCLTEVASGNAHCALITKGISIETVKKVCYSGYTLPQKSTYFYPKVICGFLFGSIKEDEFDSLFDGAFK